MGNIYSQFEASNYISMVTTFHNHVLTNDHRVMEEDVTLGATLTHRYSAGILIHTCSSNTQHLTFLCHSSLVTIVISKFY